MIVARGILALLVLTLTSAIAVAGAPENSVRPQPRAAQAGQVRTSAVPVRYDAEIRPKARPGGQNRSTHYSPIQSAAAQNIPVQNAPKARPDRMIIVVSAQGISMSPRPIARPRSGARKNAATTKKAPRVQVASMQKTPTPAVTTRVGAVCGDPAIRGRVLSPIAGRLRGCGVARPVKVSSIDGVALSQGSIMNCQTAKALKTWINKGVRPAVGSFGGGVDKLQVVAHYSCRTRNNKKGAKISEHGKGKAVDVSAIKLKNGEAITVLNDWKTRKQGKMLKRMQRSACGPFGTVLGPNADKYHRDHFHLDTASYRSGPYCR